MDWLCKGPEAGTCTPSRRNMADASVDGMDVSRQSEKQEVVNKSLGPYGPSLEFCFSSEMGSY